MVFYPFVLIYYDELQGFGAEALKPRSTVLGKIRQGAGLEDLARHAPPRGGRRMGYRLFRRSQISLLFCYCVCVFGVVRLLDCGWGCESVGLWVSADSSR